MSDTPPVPPAPPTPPVPPAPPIPPAAPGASESSRPDPYAQPAYAQPVPQPAYVTPYGTPGVYAPVPRTNTLAIVAFVLAFFVSLAAVICGHISLSQIKRTGEGGRGLALAAVIIGYVGIGFWVLYILFFVVVIVAGAASGSYSGSGN